MNQMAERQERIWAMLCHLGILAGFIIPFGHIIAPLVIWLNKKEKSVFIKDQGKESLNFQISMSAAFLLSGILSLILKEFVALLFAFIIFDIVIAVIASTEAYSGKGYRYPLTIRFIK